VHEDAVIDFVTRVPAEYEARTGLAAVPHVCRAAAGASVTMYDE
jgi:galactokinase